MIYTDSLNILFDEIFSYFKSSHKKKVQLRKIYQVQTERRQILGHVCVKKILKLTFQEPFKILRIAEAPTLVHLCGRNTLMVTC